MRDHRIGVETPESAQGVGAAHAASREPAGSGEGDLPPGWWYYGPRPPWAGAAPEETGPGAKARAPDNADLMEAFDRLSRGQVDAETLGTLFNMSDRDFWKGALAGSAAALALSKLPALKAVFAALAAAASERPGSSKSPAGGAVKKEDAA